MGVQARQGRGRDRGCSRGYLPVSLDGTLEAGEQQGKHEGHVTTVALPRTR